MISRSMLLALGLALSFAPIGCDDEDGDSDTSNDSANDTSGNDSANDSANDSNDSANDSANTSSSMETCVSTHECINDACVCTTPGMEEVECTDNEACDDECEVCM